MHSSVIEGYLFQHNGDHSGDVIIRSPNDVREIITIPYKALEEFVATKRANDLISKLESDPTIIFKQ